MIHENYHEIIDIYQTRHDKNHKKLKLFQLTRIGNNSTLNQFCINYYRNKAIPPWYFLKRRIYKMK